MRIRHVILDRDGVLNLEAPGHGYVCSPEEFHWVPGALEGLALLHAAGLRISVATNQSGVGRGIMTLMQLEAVLEKMRTDAANAGAPLDAVFFCPHSPAAGCDCRKPACGMIVAAVEASGISSEATLIVGDDLRDLHAAAAAGVRACLVRSGKGRRAESELRDPGVTVFDDLLGFARAVSTDCLQVQGWY